MIKMIEYRIFTEHGFDEVCSKISSKVSSAGFGVLAEIPTGKILRSKGFDYPLMNTYEICNPSYASRILSVEQVFDTMKGDLESDKTYLRDNEKVKGFFLIVFLALRIRFKILRVHNLLGKISVNEVIFELSKMERIVEKSGAEYFAAVPGKVEKIVDLFKDMIPMG